jgi:hypothetical protein
MWRIELDGRVQEIETRIFADRGRLIARVDGWNEDAAREFALDCAARTHRWVAVGRRERRGTPAALDAYASDARGHTGADVANVAGYVAALAAAEVAGHGAGSEERRRQAEWIGARIAAQAKARRRRSRTGS